MDAISALELMASAGTVTPKGTTTNALTMTMMNSNLVKSSTRTKRVKVPVKFPTWLCKCIWDATAIKLKIEAKDEASAWDSAWKKVARTEGGDSCLRVVVLG